MNDTVLLQFARLLKDRITSLFPITSRLHHAFTYIQLDCLFFNYAILTSIHLINIKCMFDAVVTDNKTFTSSR